MSKEKAELEAFFARFSPSFAQFAKQHGLRVDKYWHDFPSWRFSFKHPICGIACMEIMKEGEDLKAYGYWWFDDYDRGTRSVRKFESTSIDVEHVNIEGLLNEVLKEIVSWELDSWTEVNTGLESGWRKAFSKQQFEILNDTYPLLKS